MNKRANAFYACIFKITLILLIKIFAFQTCLLRVFFLLYVIASIDTKSDFKHIHPPRNVKIDTTLTKKYHKNKQQTGNCILHSWLISPHHSCSTSSINFFHILCFTTFYQTSLSHILILREFSYGHPFSLSEIFCFKALRSHT